MAEHGSAFFLPGFRNRENCYLFGLILPSKITLKKYVMGFGTQEIILIIIVILILFGGKKIPELMRGLGRGVREFNDAKTNVRREIEDGMTEKERTNTSSSTTNP